MINLTWKSSSPAMIRATTGERTYYVAQFAPGPVVVTYIDRTDPGSVYQIKPETGVPATVEEGQAVAEAHANS